MEKMVLTMLSLGPKAIKSEKITDDYSVHRVVYSLFEDVRSADDKEKGKPSGILYADKGGDKGVRKILILSDREPLGGLSSMTEVKIIHEAFLTRKTYGFEIDVNPVKCESKSGKLIALKKVDEVRDWFKRKALNAGFDVRDETLEIKINNTKKFLKNGAEATFNSASIRGVLDVVDRAKFSAAFKSGIGRGKAFGFGLLQIVPIG